ncbi:MarR family transcriptional regulator [Acrocarpospora corrugata]|uniref:MarR family transcriptional regulator n=1 Tax=Acrocarpospora corrugata TaxID=35763 RepID=A0A5M3VP60_9ACTN|nr:MarR family transcriptional regulator [Acrocarpospora corrugata]GER97998.1 MarR family transcriptional regulator [Acrocarpospora corrugata]
MDSVSSEFAAPHRRRLAVEIRESLRALGNQLALLNHHVGMHAGLKDVDLDCLELISRHGPISPSALARRAGLHPATVTGIIDRLQRDGWVVRERTPEASDRRAVAVRALRDRGAELFHLYSGMNTALDQICTGYDDKELELLAEFLRRTNVAGREATEALAEED